MKLGKIDLALRVKPTILFILLGILIVALIKIPGLANLYMLYQRGILDTLSQPTTTVIEPNRAVFRQGDLEFTTVRFRGEPLFTVTAKVNILETHQTDTSISSLRAETIENNLATLLNIGVDPQTLAVKVSNLDNLVVITASSPPNFTQEVIVTVTELDGRLAQMPVAILAREWSHTIRHSLINAYEENQPKARRQQRQQALSIALGIILVISAMETGRWLFLVRLRQLRSRLQSLEANQSEDSDSPSSKRLKYTLGLKHRINLDRSFQQVLQFGQLIVWLQGIAMILDSFPESRVWGDWVRSLPNQIVIISAVIFLLAKFSQRILRQHIRQRLEMLAFDNNSNDTRVLLRAPTIEAIFSGVINMMAVLLGIICFLIWRQINFGNILTGAGILGTALALIFQSLLKDWLNGLFIIFEDQYAVGDYVDINGVKGLVEHMNIRSTQIRAAGGRLTTIPHNQIGVVHNLTKDWSRVDFTIEISNQNDPIQAMAIMKEVAIDLQQAPDWSGDILKPTDLIGVNHISATGTQLLMWIKTQRMRQWDVEREFRRRLKLAFDQQGIEIAIPQQTLHLESLEENRLGRAKASKDQEV